MDQLKLNQQALVPFIGSKSKVSEILNKKRPLSLSMMRALHKGLGIPAEILLHEPEQEFQREIPEIDWKNSPTVTKTANFHEGSKITLYLFNFGE